MKNRAVFAIAVLAVGTTVSGEVVIETVPVGNPGNEGEWAGESYGGYGPDAIVGGVDYEYNIGKYEVTAGQYTDFLNAVAGSDPYELYNTDMWTHSYGCKIQRSDDSGSYSYTVADDWVNRPVNFVSWYDALRFANWLQNGQPEGPQGTGTTEDGTYTFTGGSSVTLADHSGFASPHWALPTEDEWHKSAYHKNDGETGSYFDYPTSSDTTPGYVNDSGNLSGTGTPFTEGGTDPGNYATYDGDSGIDGIGPPYFRTKVGEWENSDSPYGTFDMGGNLQEWTEALVTGSQRGLRGGAFNSADSLLHAAYRHHTTPSNGGDNLGFRVAQVPEPATLSLLLLGGFVTMSRRR